MFQVRLILIFFYNFFACAAGIVLCLLRWGSKDLNRDLGRLMAWGTLPLAGIKLDVQGAEYLESAQPCIYVANHQSNLDVAVFGKIHPGRAVGIGKRELVWVPLFGVMFAAAGNFMINRSNRTRAIHELAEVARQVREQKISIWFFVEGTRNRTEAELLPFKKGAFHLAVQAGVPVVPVVAERYRFTADRFRRGRLVVRVLPPINPRAGAEGDGAEALMAEVREQMLAAIRELGAGHAEA